MESQQNGLAYHQTHVPHDSAMSVGSSKEEDVERIRALEDEVKVLAERANAATQRYADYENAIRVLEAKLRQEQRKNSAPNEGSPATIAPPAVQRPGISRFNSFMSTRKPLPTPTTVNGSASSPFDRQKDLEEQLVKEQTARIAAEQKAKEVSAEIEDLSATLFEQANEMVASERKENSALKEKVEELERIQKENGDATDAVRLQKENAKLTLRVKTLEEREAQRTKRLERLEGANRRVERVRAMLKPP